VFCHIAGDRTETGPERRRRRQGEVVRRPDGDRGVDHRRVDVGEVRQDRDRRILVREPAHGVDGVDGRPVEDHGPDRLGGDPDERSVDAFGQRN